MMVFNSDCLQISYIQDINAPYSESIELVDSTVLISAKDGIYYGLYNNVKKLTLNKNTNCLLKPTGDLITIHSTYISSSNQKIECHFQPSKVLPMRQYTLYYNPNGYYSHLERNELKSFLLPHSILKKPINCAGFITIHSSDIKTLIVTGHTVYQFKNGNNTHELENTFDFGIFGIIHGQSTWYVISILNHDYCVIELNPDNLQVINTIHLHISDKLIFLNAYILHDSLLFMCQTDLFCFDLQGVCRHHIPLFDALRIVAISPLLRDDKLKLIMHHSKTNTLQFFTIQHPKTVLVNFNKDQINLINHLLYGWLPVAHSSTDDVSALQSHEFVNTVLAHQFADPITTIKFHMDACQRYLVLHINTTVLALWLFKQCAYFLLNNNLNQLFLQQCCTRHDYATLHTLFTKDLVEFNFFKGCIHYFNPSVDQVDQNYGLMVGANMLHMLLHCLSMLPTTCALVGVDVLSNAHVMTFLQHGLALMDQGKEEELHALESFVETSAVFILTILQYPSTTAHHAAMHHCFKWISRFYKNDLDKLSGLLSQYPNKQCIQNSIFDEQQPNYDLCELLLKETDSAATLVFDAFCTLKCGEMLCHFMENNATEVMQYVTSHNLPEINFLLQYKKGNYDKAILNLEAAILKYEQENGIDFNKLRLTAPKSMGFCINGKLFDYVVF